MWVYICLTKLTSATLLLVSICVQVIGLIMSSEQFHTIPQAGMNFNDADWAVIMLNIN